MVGVILKKGMVVGGACGVDVSVRSLDGGAGRSTMLQLCPRTFSQP